MRDGSINSIDQQFHQIINDLSQDIINDTQEAAEALITLSSEFLDSDGRYLVKSFNDLNHQDATQADHAALSRNRAIH